MKFRLICSSLILIPLTVAPVAVAQDAETPAAEVPTTEPPTAQPPTAETSAEVETAPTENQPEAPAVAASGESVGADNVVVEEEPAARALPAAPAGQGGVAVFPVAVTNLTGGEAAALGVLFSSEFKANSSSRVLAPATTEPFVEAMSETEAVVYMKADQYVLVEAVRLDRTIIVRASLRDSSGQEISSGKMNATTVDDFEHVAERLTRVLLDKTSVKETRTLDNITQDEGEGNNRTFVEKVFGFKTTYIIPYSSKVDLAPMVGASFDGRLEGESYFLEFGAGLLLPASGMDGDESGYGGLVGEIGASYYLANSNISPYIGAGVNPRLHVNSQPAGLAVYGQAGVMFFRTSSSRLYAELRVAQNLTELEVDESTFTDDGYVDFTSTSIRPIEFGINVGLGW